MQFDVYRPKGRQDLYLFVPAGTPPGFPAVAALGCAPEELEFFKSRELLPGQRVAGVPSEELINGVAINGFHVQAVKASTEVSDGGAAIGGGLLGASIAGPFGAIVGSLIGLVLAEHAKKANNDI